MVALLVVLGGFALFLTNSNKVVAPGAEGTPTPLPSFVWQETSIVQGIEVMSGTAKVSISKDISTTLWMITEPERSPADTFQVDNIASALQSLQATKVATGTTDLAAFGLDKPGLTVTVTFSGTTPISHTLMVGAANFDESSTYVKQPGSSDVYLVATSTTGALRNWLTTPPKEPPTPTPFPTAPPTPTETATVVPSPAGPVGPPGVASPSPSAATSPVQASPVVTGTAPPLVGEATIGASPPGSGNATTPLAATATTTSVP